MQSITLRFLASQSTLPQAGRVPGGTVLRWVDEAGFACASAWAKGPCITEFVGGAHFVHPIRPGDLVEVHARLASTTDTAMHLAVEVRSGGIHGEPLQEVLHCVAVYTANDAGTATLQRCEDIFAAWHLGMPNTKRDDNAICLVDDLTAGFPSVYGWCVNDDDVGKLR